MIEVLIPKGNYRIIVALISGSLHCGIAGFGEHPA